MGGLDDEQTCGCFSLSENETHGAQSNETNNNNRLSRDRIEDVKKTNSVYDRVL